jgi:ectoine hydroxylase-related dioxygenase (phytanoyl-CoA dioxygenase family)
LEEEFVSETQMWQRSINERGFTIIPQVLSAAETTGMLEAMDRFMTARSRAGRRHTLSLPAVASMAHDTRLLTIAASVLGTSVFPFRATLFDKSPKANWLVVWHQDTALPLRAKRELPGWGPWSIKEGVIYAHAPADALEQVLALRLHLDDSIEQNGPLRVLPGTHRLGVLNDEDIHQLALERAAIECLVPRGGVLAMRPLLVHSSSKSISQFSRRVLHVEYAACKDLAPGMELAVA